MRGCPVGEAVEGVFEVETEIAIFAFEDLLCPLLAIGQIDVEEHALNLWRSGVDVKFVCLTNRNPVIVRALDLELETADAAIAHTRKPEAC